MRTIVNSENLKLQVEELKKQNKLYRLALSIYSDKSNWNYIELRDSDELQKDYIIDHGHLFVPVNFEDKKPWELARSALDGKNIHLSLRNKKK